jgi:alkanesulfonate monooxygenase SsuD/methylene tetrahydromethanopterin reductase-like flavin-dependent oxidoreductase (luciferase family)
MGFPIRVGISIAPQDAGPTKAAEIEARGFDLLVVADHLFHYREPEQPYLDAWMRLAAFSQSTTSIRLGTLVSNLSWRQPVLLAKQAIALDHLSGGRLELGVGCGAYPDQAMAGISQMAASERVRRLAEGLEVLDRLLSGNTNSFTGEFTGYEHAEVAPGCVQRPRPPLVVAATGDRAIAVAAQWADTWNCFTGDGDLPSSLAALTAKGRLLSQSCEAAGRDPEEVRRSLLLWHSGGCNPWAHKGALLEIVERFSDLGFTDFIAFSPQANHIDILDHVCSEVLPAVHAVGG